MILIHITSTEHLAEKIKIPKGKFTIKKFSDGEVYVKIEEKVQGKKVWVLASTNPPAANLLELLFLLDALKREKAIINLLIPYFGYARQDRIEPGEAFSSKVVCDFIKKFKPKRVIVIDMHSSRLRKFLEYENIIPLEVFTPIARRMDIVVAPDEGALPAARKLGEVCELSVTYMKKVRPIHEKAEIVEVVDHVAGKRVVLIDDMISTGGTIIEAGKKLKKEGAKEISVIATHGIFAGDAVSKIEKSSIKEVFVTDSLPQTECSPKIKVIDLSEFVEGIIIKRNY